MNMDEMSRRFDEIDERHDDMMDLIMRTSEIQSRPKKHDKILEILEHKITDLQDKLNTCNEDKAKIEQDKAKIEQDKLKAEALAKRIFLSYDKLSKDKEKEAVLLVAEKMDSIVPPAKSLTAKTTVGLPRQQIDRSTFGKISAIILGKNKHLGGIIPILTKTNSVLSIRDEPYLIPVPEERLSAFITIITDKTIYLKQPSATGFTKLGTLIDHQKDTRLGLTYYYFSENPDKMYTNLSTYQMFYDPLEGNEKMQSLRPIQTIIDAEVNKGLECIKSCGLFQFMTFPVHDFGPEDKAIDYSIKRIFYGSYLKSWEGENFKFFDDKFVQEGIEQKRDNLIRLYELLSLENYNKLNATPGNSPPSNMNVTYPLAHEALTKTLVKTLIDADFPMRSKDQHALERVLGLWNQNSIYGSARPGYSMFEMAKQFIKCKIDFIEKIMMIEREITGQIGEKTVKKAGVGLGLKTKSKSRKHRKSHKRKQRRQHKRTKRNNKTTTKFKYPPQ